MKLLKSRCLQKKKLNTDGSKDARVKLKRGSDLRQTTYKDGDTNGDDSYAHFERTNGTEQKRKQYVILKKKAKKYGVKAEQPQQQQDPMMSGGMM